MAVSFFSDEQVPNSKVSPCLLFSLALNQSNPKSHFALTSKNLNNLIYMPIIPCLDSCIRLQTVFLFLLFLSYWVTTGLYIQDRSYNDLLIFTLLRLEMQSQFYIFFQISPSKSIKPPTPNNICLSPSSVNFQRPSLTFLPFLHFSSVLVCLTIA